MTNLKKLSNFIQSQIHHFFSIFNIPQNHQTSISCLSLFLLSKFFISSLIEPSSALVLPFIHNATWTSSRRHAISFWIWSHCWFNSYRPLYSYHQLLTWWFIHYFFLNWLLQLIDILSQVNILLSDFFTTFICLLYPSWTSSMDTLVSNASADSSISSFHPFPNLQEVEELFLITFTKACLSSLTIILASELLFHRSLLYTQHYSLFICIEFCLKW